MTARGTQTLTWSVQRQLAAMTGGAAFVYDGDAKRVKKTETGETVHYPNRYYEKNVTTGVITTYYCHADRLMALRRGAAIEYVHQDHVGGPSVSTDTAGAEVSRLTYLPFGGARSSTGTLGTDRKYTGQRLDGSGLYFYNARYYDAGIGRFVSPDTVVQDLADPQAFNRYSYVRNNPTKHTDTTGALVRNGVRHRLNFI